MNRPPFADRRAAGRALAAAFAGRPLAPPVVVLALPRGGVPVAAELARTLRAPLELLVVRKIGAPGQPEFAVAAIAEGDPPELVVDEPTRVGLGLERGWIEARAAQERPGLVARRARYAGGRTPVPLAGATAIVVDDGIATGTTLRAALRALRRRSPARVVLAVPVAPRDTLEALRAEVDDVICLDTPEPFDAVGRHYADFRQVEDAEVIAALAEAAAAAPGPG
ncbi:MAG: hypothetical protein RJA99_1567 [Pseudomonadota bacterium]|jgi:putative phosphoribosyl transferase